MLEKLNLSEAELAKEAGLSRASINLFLNGHNDIKRKSLIGIAKALGVSPAYLIATEEEREKLSKPLVEAPPTPDISTLIQEIGALRAEINHLKAERAESEGKGQKQDVG